MNKVNFLKQTKFSQLSIEDQLKIKNLGRDMPDLVINCDKSNRNRKFSRNVYTKNNWICGCEVTNKMFCFPCILYGNEDQWTEKGVNDLIHIGEKLRTHERNPRHMHNVVSLYLLGKLNVKTMTNAALRADLLKQNEIVEKNRQKLNEVINNVMQHNYLEYALKDTTSKINFIQEFVKDNEEIIKKFPFFKKQNENVINNLIEAIYELSQQEIQNQIKEADYVSVVLDEVYDTRSKIQLILIVRYLHENKPKEHFWNILYPEAYNAEAIAQSILQELQNFINQNDKLISFSYDGGSIATGSLQIINQLIKKQYPRCIYVHYYAHNIDLLISSAIIINKQAKIFYCNFKSLCEFLKNCQQAMNVLNEVILRRFDKNPKQWKFDVNTIYEHRKDLLIVMDFLEKDHMDEMTVNLAGGFKYKLQDENFIFWLGIFNKILPRLHTMYNFLIKDEINENKKLEEFKKFEQQILSIQLDVLLAEIETDINSTFVDFDEPLLKKPKILNQETRKQEVKEICENFISHLETRFINNSYQSATNLIKVQNFKEFRLKFPTKLLQDTLKQFPFLDSLKLTTGLQVVYERPEFRIISGLVALLDLLVDPELESVFQEVIKLLKLFATMPIETVERERCFPLLGQVRAFLKNTVPGQKANALTFLAVEKWFLKEFDDVNNLIINGFAAKNQRLEFMYRKL